MPTIYSSIYANFFRQGASLAKSLTTHGYAQSVVAATHSHVLNSQNRPVFPRRNSVGAARYGRLHSLRLHSSLAFNSATAALVGLAEHRLDRPGHANTSGSYPNAPAAANAVNVANAANAANAAGCPPTHSHGGLDAYFEALNALEAEARSDAEWAQFQFPKRIEWQPTPAAVLLGSHPLHPSADQLAHFPSTHGEPASAEVQQRTDGGSDPAHNTAVAATATVTVSGELSSLAGPVLTRPGTTPHSPVTGHYSTNDQAYLAYIDASLQHEIATRHDHASTTEPRSPSATVRPSSAPGGVSSTFLQSGLGRSSVVDSQSQSYTQHLVHLSKTGRYAEIPALFEAMLVAHIRPTAPAYNALLAAAIHLPIDRIETASKALDVYADMLRRRVVPDADTFTILVGLLASRSVEVATLKTALECQRQRFGGMDEPGRFMFASHELEHAILSEDDRVDLAISLFDTSVASGRAAYSSETYLALVAACARADRIPDMLRLFEHLEAQSSVLYPAEIFPAMIGAYARAGDLIAAVECYNAYRELAVAGDNSGASRLRSRLDNDVYAAVVAAYVRSGKPDGAVKFYTKLTQQLAPSLHAAPAGQPDVNAASRVTAAATSTGQDTSSTDAIVSAGFVDALLDRGFFTDALAWARTVVGRQARCRAISRVAAAAADRDDVVISSAAFTDLAVYPLATVAADIAQPAMALLALHVRAGSVDIASRYWDVLKSPAMPVNASYLEPTAMYAVALIGSGHIAHGLTESDTMFRRIRASAPTHSEQLADQIDEAVEFVSRYVSLHGSAAVTPVTASASSQTDERVFLVTSPATTSLPSTPITALGPNDAYDPHAATTDFRGSSLIADDLEGAGARRGPRLRDAMNRFRNMRRAGRHPRYVIYSKLIAAASREGRIDICDEILAMARSDVPLLAQYAAVRYGWTAILDAMMSAYLSSGDRTQAERLHNELVSVGAAPSANTFGLYITTLKDSTQTCDEASEAVRIFLRARAEGVEPTSFLYNALIGKLGKARRIDECLLYFAEMRSLGIKPTSVTYGTIVNALCRVSDDRFAEELFDEMESMPNYKARPAPYNSMMQFFLTTKRDKAKVLSYYGRMLARGIVPTSHTYKLLIDTHATLEPVDMAAAEGVLDAMRAAGQRPDAVHYASLIHARGCALHDLDGARRLFDSVLADGAVAPSAVVFQALLEAMVASHHVVDTQSVLNEMARRGVPMTAYIANTLIHGWATKGDLPRARAIFDAVGRESREPSTYEAMTRAYLSGEDRQGAHAVVNEMMGRGYPTAVAGKLVELLGDGN